MNTNVREISRADVQKMLRPRPADGHKGTFGHALLIVGSRGMAGAAILSAESCLRSGIGKLSILTAKENHIILQTTVPEAILKTDNGRPDTYTAIGIGPGIGLQAGDILLTYLQTATSPIVLDADALNLLALHPEWQEHLPADSVLTPHPGEAGRLIGSNKIEDVSNYAVRHRVNVVLKGHPTHVCTTDGQTYVLHVGNSGMATAGSGDVLTGIITGLLAQGYASLDAALTGVWLHGMSGDLARDEMGENCMLARDIIRHMPQAFGQLAK